MTTSELKGRFFFTKWIHSHNESNRELECSTGYGLMVLKISNKMYYLLVWQTTLNVENLHWRLNWVQCTVTSQFYAQSTSYKSWATRSSADCDLQAVRPAAGPDNRHVLLSLQKILLSPVSTPLQTTAGTSGFVKNLTSGKTQKFSFLNLQFFLRKLSLSCFQVSLTKRFYQPCYKHVNWLSLVILFLSCLLLSC